jgi:hypothetical protein
LGDAQTGRNFNLCHCEAALPLKQFPASQREIASQKDARDDMNISFLVAAHNIIIFVQRGRSFT